MKLPKRLYYRKRRELFVLLIHSFWMSSIRSLVGLLAWNLCVADMIGMRHLTLWQAFAIYQVVASFRGWGDSFKVDEYD